MRDERGFTASTVDQWGREAGRFLRWCEQTSIGLTLKSMSSKIPLGGRRPCTRSIHWPERSTRAVRFFSAASHLVSKRPIWLADAAQSEAAFPLKSHKPIEATRSKRPGRPEVWAASRRSSFWFALIPTRSIHNIGPAGKSSCKSSAGSIPRSSNRTRPVTSRCWPLLPRERFSCLAQCRQNSDCKSKKRIDKFLPEDLKADRQVSSQTNK